MLESTRSILTEIINKAAVSQPEAGDYLLNGIIHCGKCRTAKQIIIPDGGIMRTVYCLCECKAAEEVKKENERKEKERAERIVRLRRLAFSEKAMESWTFDNDDGTNGQITNVMRNYVDNFQALRKIGKGLLLYGNVGTGKTYAACEVANALIDRGVPCIVTNFARLSNELQGMYDGKQNYLDDLNNYALLVIDDLGVERKTEYMQETVFNIIDSRYRACLPMIITTNLDIEDIKDPRNAAYSRIYDRIIERCFPVEITGASRRRTAVRADYAEIKSMLGL